MPDLQRQSSIAWLHTIEPEFARRLSAPVRPIEDVAQVHPLLVELGKALDLLTAAPPGELLPRLLTDDATKLLREVLAQLGPARLLRLLAWFETEGLPEGQELLTVLIQDDRTEVGRFLQSTLRELRRQALLDRTFHPDRLALLQAVTAHQKGSN